MMRQYRFAFCIIAHTSRDLFRFLVNQIDHPENDIYVMIDKKSDINQFNDIKLKFSKIRFCERRINIKWGGFSQVCAEIELFKYASSFGHHDFYHLISGEDVLIKPVEALNEYMKSHPNKEFLGLREYEEGKKTVETRLKYYYFKPHLLRSQIKIKKVLYYIPLFCQKIIRYKRRYPKNLQMGANWCSITQSFVNEILKSESEIKKIFKYTLCCDELYKQYIALRNNIEDKCEILTEDGPDQLRKIDWVRGRPYVWSIQNIKELKESSKFFARKINPNDKELINEISKYTSSR